MSLKAFHILFVVVCIAFSAFFGVWSANDYRLHGQRASLLMAVGSFVAVPVLLWYGRWFLRKLKGVSYL
jgi:hypothetical protein